MEFPEPGNILSQHVVLDNPSIFLLIVFDDGKIIVFKQQCSMGGFTVLLIRSAFAFDDIRWHEEGNSPVHASPLLGVLGIVLLVHTMVVEEPRCFSAGVGDKRFLLGHFQFERISQELPQALLDFLCFLPWPSDYV